MMCVVLMEAIVADTLVKRTVKEIVSLYVAVLAMIAFKTLHVITACMGLVTR